MAPQRLIPGLVGMATAANAVYLRALQAADAAARQVDGALLNRLKVVMFELDFAQFVENVRLQQWPACEHQIASAAHSLKAAGADFLVITSNTGSTLVGRAREETGLPVLDIVEASLARFVCRGPVATSQDREEPALHNGFVARSKRVSGLSPLMRVSARFRRAAARSFAASSLVALCCFSFPIFAKFSKLIGIPDDGNFW